jgi:hypothetical protein
MLSSGLAERTVIMSELKMGKKGGPRNAAKKFEKVQNQPVSKRISDFLIEEGRKEKDRNNTKKIARPHAPRKNMDA